MIRDRLQRLRFRVRRGLSERGVGGLARETASRIVTSEDAFVWYVLDLERVDRIPFRPGYELHLADADEAVEILREVPAIPPEEGRERVRAGVQLWVVRKEEVPAFVCFGFSGDFPLEAARGGVYTFPDGVVCLENGYTNRKFRGRAIAPAAWTAIAERIAAAGSKLLITKVATDNPASRRTVEKTGFRPATIMHRRRRGLRTHVVFEPTNADLTPVERRTVDHLERSVAR